jgi:hypothetical protein
MSKQPAFVDTRTPAEKELFVSVPGEFPTEYWAQVTGVDYDPKPKKTGNFETKPRITLEMTPYKPANYNAQYIFLNVEDDKQSFNPASDNPVNTESYTGAFFRQCFKLGLQLTKEDTVVSAAQKLKGIEDCITPNNLLLVSPTTQQAIRFGGDFTWCKLPIVGSCEKVSREGSYSKVPERQVAVRGTKRYETNNSIGLVGKVYRTHGCGGVQFVLGNGTGTEDEEVSDCSNSLVHPYNLDLSTLFLETRL